jgi:hypothetical protein
MVMTSDPVVGREGRRYLRKPVPLFFPCDEEVPEHKLHVELRTALYQLIGLALGDRVIVGTEQFVYYDASDPRRCLAPDLMVWVDPVAPSEQLRIWDRIEGDLVERDLSSPGGYLCDALGLYWCLTEDPKLGPMLRLARDSAGLELLPTPLEAQEQAKARAREAEQRIRELEAQLAKRG